MSDLLSSETPKESPIAQKPPSAVGAWTAIIIGVGAFAAGLIASIMSYNNAVNNGGGHWRLWWGPMLFGVITAISGLVRAVRRANTPAEARHERGPGTTESQGPEGR